MAVIEMKKRIKDPGPIQETLVEALKGYTGETRWHEPIAPYTSLKVGGPADVMVFPRSVDEILFLMRTLSKHHLPYFILGHGSNLLIKDGGIEGIVIHLKHLNHIKSLPDNRILAEGGVPYPKLALHAMEAGLEGLEFAAGIPGSVGGAVVMNAGIPGIETAPLLETIRIADETGHLHNISARNALFSYRNSSLQKGVVVSASFHLSSAAKKQIGARMKALLKKRQETQPLNFSNCGSIFKNPLHHYAGALIEQAGLKGFRIGNAEISARHGNFIINRGSASAQDCLALIKKMYEAAYRLYGVSLALEVKVFGRD